MIINYILLLCGMASAGPVEIYGDMTTDTSVQSRAQVTPTGEIRAQVNGSTLAIHGISGSPLDVNCLSGCSGGGNSGSYTVTPGTGSFNVNGSTLAIVNASGQSISVTFPSAQAVTQSGAWTVTVTASDLDIRNLSSSQDSVKAEQQNSFTVTPGTGTWAAAQSGTWTVQPGNTANTTPWLTAVNGSTVAVTPAFVSAAINDGACVSVSATTTVLASNASRRTYSVCARVSNTDTVFIKLGATATTSDYPLEPGQCDNSDATFVYTGVIDAIANSGTQSVCVKSL